MDLQELESVVARILAGVSFFKSEGSLYRVLDSTPEQSVLADYIVAEACEDLAYTSNFMERIDAELIHQRMGTWTNQDDLNIKASEAHVDDLKIALYKTLMSKKKQKQIRKQLEGVRKSLSLAYFKKDGIYAGTLETHKKNLKDKFLTAINISDLAGNHPYTVENFWTEDSYLANAATEAVAVGYIGQDVIREASRKNPWRSYWNAAKADVFSKPLAEVGSVQRLIVTFSQMYDNARQHPECPADDVFDDDDVFDGWMLHDNKLRVKEQRQKQIDSTVGSKGDEVFIMASDQEEANEIFDVNHDRQRFQMGRKLKQIRESDRNLDDIELVDNQEKLQVMSNQQAKDRRK
mgnify:CR=1 FL=1|tara:strand:+ start:7720 stop:8766 length:1047 start_codon:yes stop_codon:yes gene_type:complete